MEAYIEQIQRKVDFIVKKYATEEDYLWVIDKVSSHEPIPESVEDFMNRFDVGKAQSLLFYKIMSRLHG